jgi:hypothetical protein
LDDPRPDDARHRVEDHQRLLGAGEVRRGRGVGQVEGEVAEEPVELALGDRVGEGAGQVGVGGIGEGGVELTRRRERPLEARHEVSEVHVCSVGQRA